MTLRRPLSETTAPPTFAEAAERHLDRLIIVNKIDAPGVDLPGLLAQIQATFGKECLPLNLPAAGPKSWAVGVGLMLLFGVIVGILPALRAMRVNITDALAGRA